MTKKEAEKREVHMVMTKGEIISKGYNAYLKKTLRRAVTILVVLLFISLGLSYVATWAFGIGILAMFLFWIGWIQKGNTAGKRLWDEVKGKTEPIKL